MVEWASSAAVGFFAQYGLALSATSTAILLSALTYWRKPSKQGESFEAAAPRRSPAALSMPMRRSLSRAMRAMSPQRLMAADGTSPSRRLVLKAKSLLRATRRQVKARGLFTGATRRKLRQISSKARHEVMREARQIKAAAHARRDRISGKISQRALGGKNAMKLMRALGERDGRRMSKLLSQQRRDSEARATAYSQRRELEGSKRAQPASSPGACEGTGGLLPIDLPSDSKPWDRLHVWLVAGEGLPYRPPGWLFEPYVVVSADVVTGCASQAVSAYEFKVRTDYVDARAPVWDERGLLCFRRGEASRFRVLLGAQGWIFGGIFSADLLHPLGLLRALCRVLSFTPPPPPSQASLELPAAGGGWEERKVPLRSGGTLTLQVRVSAWEERPVARMPPPPCSAPPPPSEQAALGRRPSGPAACPAEDDGSSDTHASSDRGEAAGRLAAGRLAASSATGQRGDSAVAALAAARSGAEDMEGAHPESTDEGGGAHRRWREYYGVVDEVLCLRDGEKAVLSYCLQRIPTQRAASGAGVGESGMAHPSPPASVSLPEVNGALLWLPGRNDAFFHWHMLPMLQGCGFDLFVLSYRRVGECMRLGFVSNPMHISHTVSGDFGEYHEEMSAALNFIQGGGAGRRYKRTLGYAHSTGAPILLDYPIAHGDGRFSSFVFNSPFLAWGWDLGPLTSFVITTRLRC